MKNIFNEAEAVIVAQYKGLNSETIDELRTKTRDSNVSFKVTKNRLIKIALTGGEYENISDLCCQISHLLCLDIMNLMKAMLAASKSAEKDRQDATDCEEC